MSLISSVFSFFFGSTTEDSSDSKNQKNNHNMAAYIEGEEYLIGYITDLEGNYSYWNHYKKISKILTIDIHTEKLILKPNCYFIHGGDVVDRGNGDIRILRDLLQLKTDYPDRVFFIIGNRDANKLRLYFSLHETVLKYRPDAYWVAPAQIPADFPLDNQKEKLLWVLKATMGAPFAFENRREELQELNPGRSITDLDIIASFLSLVHPGRPDNLLLQYLKHGSMAVVIGDTLFVHGAVTPFELGYVPPSYDRSNNRPTEKRYILDDPHAWVQAINAFLAGELKDYEECFYSYQDRLKNTSSWEELKELLWDSKGDYESPQPGSRLAQCGMGMKYDKSPNPGTTYASYLSNGKPVRINEDVANWLHRGGLNKVIVGHQPNGDTPLIINHLDVVTISADSSYSKFLMWQPHDIAKATFLTAEEKTKLSEVAAQDFVGIDKALTTHLGKTLPAPVKASEQANTRSDVAVNEVVISFDQRVLPFAAHTSVRGKVSVHGKISLGAQYDSNDSDPFVGKETSDGWFVKAANAKFENDPTIYYVLAQSEGFNFRSKLVPISQIESLFPRA